MFDAKDYILYVSQLAKGANNIDIRADKSLFDQFDNQDIEGLNAHICITIYKTDRFLELDFNFSGQFDVLCSRCLKIMQIDIAKVSELYIKFTDKTTKFDDNQWTIADNEDKIDLSEYIYEELAIALPLAPVHKKASDCDQQMLEKLSLLNAKNQNKKHVIDPRWAKLQELKTNKN